MRSRGSSAARIAAAVVLTSASLAAQAVPPTEPPAQDEEAEELKKAQDEAEAAEPFATPEDLSDREDAGPPPEAAAEAKDSGLLDSLPPIQWGGGVYLWHYQPFIDGADPDTSIYWVYLTMDVDLPGEIDFHFQPMFRDEKLRTFFTSNVWIQEVYLNWKPGDGDYGELKAGKIYSRFGRFWDGSFYGNVPYFDGLKLDPDLGLSYERTFEMNETISVETSLQYFSRDGSTNGSLDGRDTLSFPDAVQRNIFVGRAAPTFVLGEGTSLTVGASAMAFDADFEAPDPSDEVTRWDLEAAVNIHDLTIFGEYASQDGTHALDFPVAGINESDIGWIMSGITYQATDWLQLGYRYSFGDYHDSDTDQTFHMPRVQFQLTEATAIWLEYVRWDQDTGGAESTLDDSLNIVFYAYF